MTQELVIVGARVVTADGAAGGPAPPADALAMSAGRIVAVGAQRDVRAHVGPHAQVLAVDGAAVLPGLTDAHCHVVQGSLMALGVDLSGCRSLAQVRDRLAAAAPDATGWVRAFGLDHNVFGDRPVSGEPFERALDGVPAAIRLYDAHSLVANRAALRLAGISGRERLDGPARVVVDENGEPTGHLLEEEAMALLQAVLPAPDAGQRRAALLAAERAMAAVGLTGGHVMDDLPGTVEALDDLTGAAGAAGLRWRVYGWLRPTDSDDRLEELSRRAAAGFAPGRLWRHAGVKLFLDGTVEGGTAWLETPDSHGTGTSSIWGDPQAYARVVLRLDRAGVPTATHAIGDAAVAHAVAVLSRTARPCRHRIEHLETVPAPTLDALAAAGIVASVQPTHCTRTTRADGDDEWSRRLGPERASRGWPVADLRRRGVTVAFGSDWPVAHYDPRAIMADAVLRHPVDEPDDRPRQPGQQVTVQQALEGFTVAAARAAGELDGGVVRVGAPADLTVLAQDPRRLTPRELAEVGVVATVVDGRVVHHA